MRASITGATLLAAGLLIGVLISPEMLASARVPARTAGPSPAGTLLPPAPTGSPRPTGTAVQPSAAVPSTGQPTATAPGAPEVFDPARPVTVALGDSITFNASSWFRQLCTGSVLVQNCLNAGIRGNTTTQMLARLESDVLVYRPAIVFVMGGTNDLRRREKPRRILRRLGLLVERATTAGAVTVLCTIPPRDGYGEQVLAVNALIRDYAAANNVPLLDMYDAVGNRKGTYKPGMSRDGTHPNLKGYDLMIAVAERRLPVVLHLVTDPTGTGRLDPAR